MNHWDPIPGWERGLGNNHGVEPIADASDGSYVAFLNDAGTKILYRMESPIAAGQYALTFDARSVGGMPSYVQASMSRGTFG